MITKAQADHLNKIIKKLVEAEVADSWKGGGDPQDIPRIEKELVNARKRYKQYINYLRDDCSNESIP